MSEARISDAWTLSGDSLDQEPIRVFSRAALRDMCAARPAGTEGFHRELVAPYRDLGLLSYTIPKEWGGVGGNVLSEAVLAAELAYTNVSAALLFTDQAVCTAVLETLATDAQKEWLYPEMHRGAVFGIALTEPEAGSDAGSLVCRATPTDDGFSLSGRKIFITNGDSADYLIVFARVAEGMGAGDIAAFLVERTTEGATVGRHEQKMGLWGTSTVEMELDGCLVPHDRVLGDIQGGFRAAMVALERGRVAIGGVAIGITERVLDLLTKAFSSSAMLDTYGNVRQAAEFGMADIYTELSAARLLILEAGNRAAAGNDGVRAITSAAKVFATDVAMRAASNALSIISPEYLDGDDWNELERQFRDAKILQIFEGANELLRWLIARELQRAP